MNKINIVGLLGIIIITMSKLSSCHSDLDIKTAQYAVNGQKLYTTHCQNCHGAKGEGLGKLYPPLTDNKYFRDNRTELSRIVKYGMTGPVNIHGQEYNQQMPSNPTLSAMDIAYILTYVTTHFGDHKEIYHENEVIEALNKN